MNSTSSAAGGDSAVSTRSVALARSGAERRELRDFGLTLGGLLAAIFGLLLPLLHRRAIPWWPWVLAVVLAATAMLSPGLLRQLYRGWSALGAVLGWINTRIILSVLFYAVITPMGVVGRVLGMFSTRTVAAGDGRSYRIASREISRRSFERPF